MHSTTDDGVDAVGDGPITQMAWKCPWCAFFVRLRASVDAQELNKRTAHHLRTAHTVQATRAAHPPQLWREGRARE